MATGTIASGRFTPGDLLTMPDGNLYELVDGELVEKTMSMWSSYVGGRLFHFMSSYCDRKMPGWVFPEGTSYQCFPDVPEKVRRPDVSFIRLARLTPEQATQQGHGTMVADLFVEVVSPNDIQYNVDRKVQEYLHAGAKLVWVINPDVKTVEVHRADGTGVILNEKDQLSGEDVLPGFTCLIADLFIYPQPASVQ